MPSLLEGNEVSIKSKRTQIIHGNYNNFPDPIKERHPKGCLNHHESMQPYISERIFNLRDEHNKLWLTASVSSQAYLSGHYTAVYIIS